MDLTNDEKYCSLKNENGKLTLITPKGEKIPGIMEIEVSQDLAFMNAGMSSVTIKLLVSTKKDKDK